MMTEATAAVVRQPGGDFTIETIEVEAPRAGEVRARLRASASATPT